MKRQNKARSLVITSMLSAVAFALAFLELPMLLSPSFAKMDLSDVPALIAAFALGPMAGVLVELIKNALQLLSTNTAGIGELANFLMGLTLVAPAGFVYAHKKTKRTALIGGLWGSGVMAVVAGIVNCFILLPMYQLFTPIDRIIALFSAFLPFIRTKLDVVLWSIVPGNLIKAALVCAVTIMVYKPLSIVLKGVDSHT